RSDPGEPAAGDDERQKRLLQAGALRIGLLETLDETIPERDRVPERFHRERVLLDTRQVVEVRHGAERDHEMIVFKLVVVVLATVRNHNTTRREVDRLNIAPYQLQSSEELP